MTVVKYLHGDRYIISRQGNILLDCGGVASIIMVMASGVAFISMIAVMMALHGHTHFFCSYVALIELIL